MRFTPVAPTKLNPLTLEPEVGLAGGSQASRFPVPASILECKSASVCDSGHDFDLWRILALDPSVVHD